MAVAQINGKAFAAELDVTDDLRVKGFIQQILSDHKRIDILVNNAGYPFDNNIWYKKFHEGNNEELDRIIEVDLKGSVRLSRAVIPVMLQNTSTTSENEAGNGNEGE
jgi:NADP-dependent 3-hydroxy acid dehydrogenase YdfG